MTDRICSVPECHRPGRTRNLCNTHYRRLQRTGGVGTTPIRAYATSACQADGCNRPHHGLGYCGTHYRRLVEFGDIDRAKIMPSGEQHWNWRGIDVGYPAAHDRVARERGPASAHACEHCAAKPAEDWAYDHQDPNERIATQGPAANCRYSADPAHYIPLCKSCHRRFDNAAKESEAS